LAYGTPPASEPLLKSGSTGEDAMNNIIYLVGLVVVVAFIASFVLGNV
jgi:hypothetical protein